VRKGTAKQFPFLCLHDGEISQAGKLLYVNKSAVYFNIQIG